MNPSGMSSEDSKSLTWPQTVVLMPRGSMRLVKSHISCKILNIELEIDTITFFLEVLNEDIGPLLASDVVSQVSDSFAVFPSKIDTVGRIHMIMQFLVGFVVLVVEWPSLQVDDSSAPIQVVDGGSQGYLGSESVTSEGSHSQLLLVHEPHHIIRDILPQGHATIANLPPSRNSSGGPSRPCF